MERANLLDYLVLGFHFCWYNPGVNDELWKQAFHVLLLSRLKCVHCFNRISIFSRYFFHFAVFITDVERSACFLYLQWKHWLISDSTSYLISRQMVRHYKSCWHGTNSDLWRAAWKDFMPLFSVPWDTQLLPQQQQREIGVGCATAKPLSPHRGREAAATCVGSPVWMKQARRRLPLPRSPQRELWHRSAVALGWLRFTWVFLRSRRWGPWGAPAGCWRSRQLLSGSPLPSCCVRSQSGSSQTSTAGPGSQLHPATSMPYPESTSWYESAGKLWLHVSTTLLCDH